MGEGINRIDEVVFKYKQGLNCAQSVFSTYAPLLGIDENLSLKITSTFGAGIARTGEVCGAITGTLMVLGLIHGRDSRNQENMMLKEVKEYHYEYANSFIIDFKAEFSYINCNQLLECDMTSEKGRLKAKEQNLSEKLCSKYVAFAGSYIEGKL